MFVVVLSRFVKLGRVVHIYRDGGLDVEHIVEEEGKAYRDLQWLNGSITEYTRSLRLAALEYNEVILDVFDLFGF